MDTEYVSSKEYAEDPDYTESMETPNYRNGSARSWADHGRLPALMTSLPPRLFGNHTSS